MEWNGWWMRCMYVYVYVYVYLFMIRERVNLSVLGLLSIYIHTYIHPTSLANCERRDRGPET